MKWEVCNLSTLTTDAAGKLDVLGHDGDTLGVDGAQVGVLKQTDEVSLAGLLEGHDSGGLQLKHAHHGCGGQAGCPWA